ncbi:MAG: mechanosensitive ion channel [Hyphomonadaceae bacterium]|nr:mechanosensitive ion channel [Hyphomonadaceae bacterium]
MEKTEEAMQSIEGFLSGFMPAWLVDPVMAIATIIVGYFISKIAASIVAGAINRTGIGRKAQTTGGNIGKSLSKAVFWVLWLVFILMALSGFEQLSGEGGPLEPLNGMLSSVFSYLPNLIGTALLLAIGFIVAKVGKEATQSTLEAAQVDNLVNKISAGDIESSTPSNGIAKAVGGLIGAIIILFFGAAAADTLQIDAISGPVSGMLDMILDYIPKILAATAILAISIYIGRWAKGLAENTLPSLGFDNSLNAIGGLDGESSAGTKPSKIVGLVAFVGIALLGLTAAFNALQIPQLSEVFETLLSFGGSITLGAIIIGAGLFIANFVSRLVTQTSGELAGRIIKYVTVVLVTFMGLSQMGIGQDIVNTAFEYSLGAVAFAAGVGGAIAFGLGGRDWAKGKLGTWFPNKPKSRAKK